MPRKQKKYHFIYKTTNLINNKFYVGMHSTDNLEDGYFGSGKILQYSVNKHGIENHQVEILEFLSSREELKKREAEVVNEELLADPLCMNLKFGGEGGGKFWNEEHRKAFMDAALAATKRRIADEGLHPNLRAAISNAKFVDGARYDWTGKRHSPETIQKMRRPKNLGESNSQFGTCWICNDEEVKKIKKEDLQSWLDNGWRKGRK